jgi:hypothetical protein
LVFESGHNTYDESYGNNGEVGVINDAILDVRGGSISVYLVSTDFAKVNVFDGDIDELWTRGNSVAKIYGGLINLLKSEDSSLVYLYAYDVMYHPAGGGIFGDRPFIEGTYYENDTPFSFLLAGTVVYPHIQVVPEPATIFLLGLGGLLLRSRKNIKY